MADAIEALEVRLEGVGHPPCRVGILARDPGGNVRFVVDDTYIDLGPTRPILGAAWHVPGDDDLTVRRLRDGGDKMARNGFLPPWFDNLLPEGALRNMVEAQMSSGRVAPFDVLLGLGGDLPGGLLIRAPGDEVPASSMPTPVSAPGALRGDEDGNDELPRLRFSLAGVQLKFSAMKRGERLTAPAAAGAGQIIAKLPSARFPHLPEVEYVSMKLAEAAGVETARCSLVAVDQVDGVPKRLLAGSYVLAVERFDRTAEGRVHVEDFAQLFGAAGDQKYSRSNEESIVRAVKRFTNVGAVEEAIRRIIVNILIGNTDAHLKNWSFCFPGGDRIALAPAYDIVAVNLLSGDNAMALRLRGTRNPVIVDVARFQGFARYVGLTDARMGKLVQRTVERAGDAWRQAAAELRLSREHWMTLDGWWHGLALTKGVSSPFS
jgi:serine/threonine-protein kinase HipA